MLLTSDTAASSIQETVLGVAHSERASIYGPEGLHEYLRDHRLQDFQPIYGNYAIIRKEAESARISTDHFGLFRLYIYRSGGFWAVSDSWQALVRTAHHRSLPITPYPPAAYAFFLQRGVGQQLASFRTPVAEIQLVPHWLDIKISSGCLSFVQQPHLPWSPDLHQTLFETARFFASLLTSFIDAGYQPLIRMSAGLDSRCTLAGMLSVPNKDKLKAGVGLHTYSGPGFEHERKIVLSMLKRLPFEEASHPPAARRTGWSGFKQRFLGTQTQLAPYPSYGPPSPVYAGASGELARVFYEWGGDLSGISVPEVIPSAMRDSIFEDINDAIMGFEGQGSEMLTVENKHYHMFRNRFHFGRTFTESIFYYPPLVYSLLSHGSGSGNYRPIYNMLFSLGGKPLLKHPFDLPKKNHRGMVPFSWKRIELNESDLFDRTIYFGGQSLEAAKTTLYGIEGFDPAEAQRTKLTNRDFFHDCAKAIDEVEGDSLLNPTVIRSARKQLGLLQEGGDSKLPGLFPALMACLSLSVCTGAGSEN